MAFSQTTLQRKKVKIKHFNTDINIMTYEKNAFFLKHTKPVDSSAGLFIFCNNGKSIMYSLISSAYFVLFVLWHVTNPQAYHFYRSLL